MVMIKQALSDLRVLDLSTNIAGAYCTRLLADYGADVIKIEDPCYGDPSRNMGPFPKDEPDRDASGLFIHLNGNKRGITLDIETTTGIKILKDLILRADVMVETFSPQYLPSLNLNFGEIRQINPNLVMTSITPFGQTGPYRNHKATDVGIFAMSGRMYVHGLPDQPPLPYGPDVIWYQIGTTAAAATMGALFVSKLQGIGQQVDISALETLVGNVDNRTLFYAYTGKKNLRGRWPGGIPQGAYPCLDGYVIFGVGYDIYFRRLCDAMGRPDLYHNPKWSNAKHRAENAEEFEIIFIEWLMQHSKREVFELCQAKRVMCSPILTFEELLQDPQLVARSFFTKIIHPTLGGLPTMGAPFKMTETPWQNLRAAPQMGQHNREILGGELGYTAADISRLRGLTVI